jgi:Uma2 family endonuclease
MARVFIAATSLIDCLELRPGSALSTQFEFLPDCYIPGQILPLANGDHLTRFEFERRWEATPHLKCAELIEGIVFTTNSVPYTQHGRPSAFLAGWAGFYAAYTSDVQCALHTCVRLDLENMPQPDVLLRTAEQRGGQSRVSADDYLEGAPEFVAEVSASTSSIELHDKFNVYRRFGVREYIVWRVLEQAVDWFALRDGQYVRLEMDEHQFYRSGFYPGLWLDVPALLRGDSQAVLATLQLGLESNQHAEFNARMGNQRG